MEFKGPVSALRRIALFAVASMITVGAVAQTVPDTAPPPSAGLNLPSNLTAFGKSDPNIRKATAIINGFVVTGTDVDHRLALVVLANGGKVAPEEKERLRLQVLRNIIDETLQIQEAKTHDIEIPAAEVQQSFDRVSARFQRTPAVMTAYLKAQGSSERSIKRQIQGELAWSRLIRRRIEPSTNVSDQEVAEILKKLEANKGKDEYHVGEIFLAATPENINEVTANGRKIIEQIKSGGSFAAYARQFSESSGGAVGGDLGWLQAAQLPAELGQAIQEISVGQIAGPIANSGGVSIIYLTDKRKVLTADPRDAVLNLRQMSIKFAPGTTPAAATARAESFAKATQAMQGCGKAGEVAAAQNADVIDNDQVKVRDLPPQLQDVMLKLSIGQATQPFGSQTEGVRVFVLCGRDEGTAANAPTAESIRAMEEEKRVSQRAQRYLRDLRRDAVIDYR